MSKHSKYKDYLGDSVYADFDGYHIILTTENSSYEPPSNTIALESNVLRKLEQYKKYLIALIEEEGGDGSVFK
jgi:hypothetical protein